jgi:hypothetical protein
LKRVSSSEGEGVREERVVSGRERGESEGENEGGKETEDRRKV